MVQAEKANVEAKDIELLRNLLPGAAEQVEAWSGKKNVAASPLSTNNLDMTATNDLLKKLMDQLTQQTFNFNDSVDNINQNQDDQAAAESKANSQDNHDNSDHNNEGNGDNSREQNLI